ncbi:MAG: TetR/AcrR family transcriptional regulator [Anaerolineae bacterium]|nr:TetR/AcrR family transcriptional regulator [Anaerolineae bacterium]
MSKAKENLKAQQAQATIEKLLAVARQEFSAKGYAAASTEEIVQQAGVTRGALYHHFPGKQGLFVAVFEAAQGEINRRIVAAADAAGSPWEQLLAGCRAFLEACIDPQLQQIVVIDAPAVLGWALWRQVDAAESVNSLRHSLAELIEAGLLKPLPLEALTHLLSGAMNEAAVWIAQTDDPARALAEATSTLEVLLAALRVEHKPD